MRSTLRILHGLMALLFLFAAALQYNDADVLRWMAIYLAAAAVCLFALAGRAQPGLAAVVGFIAFGWVALYLVRGAWQVPLSALFSQWEMKDETITAGREMYGLLIVGGAMALTWFTGHRLATPAR